MLPIQVPHDPCWLGLQDRLVHAGTKGSAGPIRAGRIAAAEETEECHWHFVSNAFEKVWQTDVSPTVCRTPLEHQEMAMPYNHLKAFQTVLHNPRSRDVYFVAQRATLHNPVKRLNIWRRWTFEHR